LWVESFIKKKLISKRKLSGKFYKARFKIWLEILLGKKAFSSEKDLYNEIMLKTGTNLNLVKEVEELNVAKEMRVLMEIYLELKKVFVEAEDLGKLLIKIERKIIHKVRKVGKKKWIVEMKTVNCAEKLRSMKIDGFSITKTKKAESFKHGVWITNNKTLNKCLKNLLLFW